MFDTCSISQTGSLDVIMDKDPTELDGTIFWKADERVSLDLNLSIIYKDEKMN
jgi:hypothetical protein